MIFKTTASFPKSGNPGYIQSYPLIAGNALANANFKISQYLERMLLNGVNSGTCLTEPPQSSFSNYYYEPNIDNSISFERSIVYGCTFTAATPSISLSIFKDINNKIITNITQFGNGKPENNLDWIEINYNNLDFGEIDCKVNEQCEVPFITMNLLYADVGAVNNTQSMLMYIDYKQNTILTNSRKVGQVNQFQIYQKVNFFKYPLPSTKWYAPDPGFIRLPRNIMYPFRIGTTNYTQSSCYIDSKILLLIMTIIVVFTT